MSTLFVARHGETDYNLKRIFQGATDVPLNARGREQAAGLLSQIIDHGISLEHVISSPYRRALDTAVGVARHFGLEIEKDSEFRERELGILEGVAVADIPHKFPEFWARYKDVSFYEYTQIPGGESLEQLEARISKAVERVLRDYGNRRVLLVTHGFASLMIHKYFGFSVGGYHLQNCQLMTYDTTRRLAELKDG